MVDHISNIISILKKCNGSKLSTVADENNNLMTNNELLGNLILIEYTDGDVETSEVGYKNFHEYCICLRMMNHLNMFDI